MLDAASLDFDSVFRLIITSHVHLSFHLFPLQSSPTRHILHSSRSLSSWILVWNITFVILFRFYIVRIRSISIFSFYFVMTGIFWAVKDVPFRPEYFTTLRAHSFTNTFYYWFNIRIQASMHAVLHLLRVLSWTPSYQTYRIYGNCIFIVNLWCSVLAH